MDTIIKGSTGQPEYKPLEINDDVFHVPVYKNRQGFDEAFEKFKKLSDNNERKKKLLNLPMMNKKRNQIYPHHDL